MTEAEEFQAMRVKRELEAAKRRAADGDFAYGQIVGATFVLDSIGAPLFGENGSNLTVGARLQSFLKRRDIDRGIVKENAISHRESIEPSGDKPA